MIKPGYPKADGPGRPTVGVERMLRLHCLQQWFNLSDPAVEEALYDSRAMRQFVGIDLGREPVPAETTICKFRHVLEAHELGTPLFIRIGEYLTKQGLQVSRGTIVDATIISAPSSTKNRPKERDPEMHQTKKGTQWYCGMKAHIGVDSQTKLIHSVAAGCVLSVSSYSVIRRATLPLLMPYVHKIRRSDGTARRIALPSDRFLLPVRSSSRRADRSRNRGCTCGRAAKTPAP